MVLAFLSPRKHRLRLNHVAVSEGMNGLGVPRIQSLLKFGWLVAVSEGMNGLGVDVRTIKNICRDDSVALDAIDQATQKKPGGNNNPHGCVGKPNDGTTFNNVQVDSTAPVGNSRDAALRRLRKDRPDLHESAGGRCDL